jgi:hypothetical protein
MQSKPKYRFEFKIKQHPTTGVCKITKYKVNVITGKVLSYSTAYKNLDLSTANEYMYFLERGKLPI